LALNSSVCFRRCLPIPKLPSSRTAVVLNHSLTTCPKNGGNRNMPFDPDRRLTYEVAIAPTATGDIACRYEVLRNAEPHPGHAEPFKLLEATPHRSAVFDRAGRHLVPFDEALPQSDSGSEDPAKALGAVQYQGPSLRLSQMTFFNQFPEASWTRLFFAMMAFYPGFNLSAIRSKPSEVKPELVLHQNGENLGTVLHEILNRADAADRAEELRGFLHVAYPGFGSIHAETAVGTPGSVWVRVRENGLNRSLELWDISDGMLRFLCLGAILLTPFPPPLIAIDEPELGLHPRLLPIVADMLKTAAERTQVLVTTHSPDLLTCFDLDSIAVMAREHNKAVWSKPGNRRALRKMLDSVTGDTLADLHRSGELEAMG